MDTLNHFFEQLAFQKKNIHKANGRLKIQNDYVDDDNDDDRVK